MALVFKFSKSVSSKATPLYLPQTAPLTGYYMFKGLRLWEALVSQSTTSHEEALCLHVLFYKVFHFFEIIITPLPLLYPSSEPSHISISSFIPSFRSLHDTLGYHEILSLFFFKHYLIGLHA